MGGLIKGLSLVDILRFLGIARKFEFYIGISGLSGPYFET